MRATSLPTAHLVAAAALALVAVVLASLAVPSTAAADRWLRPVPGEVVRPFSYSRAAPFVAGAHRGADLGARPGTAVRAACAGRVVHAAAVAGSDKVVSISCRGRRVSYLPLATIAVRSGAAIRAGAPIGTVAAGHGGLHVGVRREDDRFAYEDPLALIPPSDRPFAPAPRGRAPNTARPRPVAVPRSSPPAPDAAPHAVPAGVPRSAARRPHAAPHWPRPRSAPHSPPPRSAPHSQRPRTQPHSPPPRTAPLPVWTGLALVLAGAAGSGTVALRCRRRRASATVATGFEAAT